MSNVVRMMMIRVVAVVVMLVVIHCQVPVVVTSEQANKGEEDSFLDRVERFRNTPTDEGVNFVNKLSAANAEALTGTFAQEDDGFSDEHYDGVDVDLLSLKDAAVHINPPFVGAKVLRGPTWKWGNLADGGFGHSGKIVGEGILPYWWLIQWESGHQNYYRHGNGYQDFLVLNAGALDGVTVIGNPTRVAWTQDPKRPFAEQIASLDEPLVLTNTTATLLPAMKKWTFERLSRLHGDIILTRAKATKRRKEGATPFLYYHSAPLTSDHKDVRDYKQKSYSLFNTTMKDLVENITTSPLQSIDMPIGLWAGKLDDLGVEFLADVFPLDMFMVLQPGFDPELEHLYRQTHVWFGGTNTSTPVHFDIFHNFFVQVQGRKRFLLFPPSQWQHLYLHPLIHPAGRSCQVDLDAPRDSQIHDFPNYAKNHVLAIETILNPGEVLYIPPHWFHHVTSLEPSISFSVWTDYDVVVASSKLLEEVSLPIMKTWSETERCIALRIYFESVVESLDLGMNTGEFVFWTLLDNRFKYLHADIDGINDTIDNGPYCDVTSTTTRMLNEYGDSLFKPYLRKVVGVFKTIKKVGGDDRLFIELANYLELSASSVVGPTHTKQFLHDLAYC
eukprot:m.110704 g.110704  ORF g.110704 m.110704 type:complete len:615 (+) comp9227_c0_seq6:74-1918(+)